MNENLIYFALIELSNMNPLGVHEGDDIVFDAFEASVMPILSTLAPERLWDDDRAQDTFPVFSFSINKHKLEIYLKPKGIRVLAHRHIHCDFYQPKLISNLPQ